MQHSSLLSALSSPLLFSPLFVIVANLFWVFLFCMCVFSHDELLVKVLQTAAEDVMSCKQAPSSVCVCVWWVWSDSSAHTQLLDVLWVVLIERGSEVSPESPCGALWDCGVLTGSTQSRGGGGGACSFSSLSQNITGVLIKTNTHRFLNTWSCHCWVHLWCQTMWLFVPAARVCVWILADRQKMWNTDKEVGLIRKHANEGENAMAREAQSDRENRYE